MTSRKYRSFWRRFFALQFDGLLLAPISAVGQWMISLRPSSLAIACIALVVGSSPIIYRVVMHVRYGRTFGKMMTGVTVLGLEGSLPSFRQAVLRDCWLIVFVLLHFSMVAAVLVAQYYVPMRDATGPFLSVIRLVAGVAAVVWLTAEVITLLGSDRRRALHDYIAGTVVARSDELNSTAPRRLAGARTRQYSSDSSGTDHARSYFIDPRL